MEYVLPGGKTKVLEVRAQEESVDVDESHAPELFIRRGEESELVDDGVNEVSGCGWDKHGCRHFVVFSCWR